MDRAVDIDLADEKHASCMLHETLSLAEQGTSTLRREPEEVEAEDGGGGGGGGREGFRHAVSVPASRLIIRTHHTRQQGTLYPEA